jgi:hypothetical protein
MPRESQRPSGCKGVYWHQPKLPTGQGAWVAEIKGPEGRLYLGRFGEDLEAAKRAVRDACRMYWGQDTQPDFELDPYLLSPREREEMEAMEYPIPGRKLLNQMMREAT